MKIKLAFVLLSGSLFVALLIVQLRQRSENGDSISNLPNQSTGSISKELAWIRMEGGVIPDSARLEFAPGSMAFLKCSFTGDAPNWSVSIDSEKLSDASMQVKIHFSIIDLRQPNNIDLHKSLVLTKGVNQNFDLNDINCVIMWPE